MAKKTILVTGSTDGIGLLTAKKLLSLGHTVLFHGRNKAKVDRVIQELDDRKQQGVAESFAADLSKLDQVERMASEIQSRHDTLDALINNAGIFKTSGDAPVIVDGLDIRFTVNTIAPYLLTKKLLPLLAKSSSRVVNVSSAAQATPDLEALNGKYRLQDDFSAYAQSKLAIVMWTNFMAASSSSTAETTPTTTTFVSVNPGSYLGTKMVRDGFGIDDGNDVNVGADILIRAALSEDFADASGKYYDNDSKRFASPRPAALDARHCETLVQTMEEILASKGIVSTKKAIEPAVTGKEEL